MTDRLDYNFLKLEYKEFYNEIIEIENATDLDVICKRIFKLLKDIIEIIYKDNKLNFHVEASIKECIEELENNKSIPVEIINIFKELENSYLDKCSERKFNKQIYELIVWFVINYGEEDYSLFFNKLNVEEKFIFNKYLQNFGDKKHKTGEILEYKYIDETSIEDSSIDFVEKGENYYFGRGVDRNVNKARKYFEKAAKLGNEYGEVYLGLFYEKGLGGEQSIEEAMYWYKKAAIKENAFAQYSIGYLYFNGEGVEQNYEDAFNWYKKAAENGFAAAQHALAYLYKMGEGCEESIFKAYYWLEEAAENDFEDSFYVIGESYFEGVYVDLNYKKAYKYLSKAAEIGNENALESLGDMYYFGFYVDEDKNKAFKLYRESIELGNTELYYKLGKIYEDEGKYKTAINYYKKGHKSNDVRATQKLGVLYYNGEIVEKDSEKSLEYMKIAAEKNQPHALYVIGIYYLNRDRDSAIKYLKKAYKLGSIHAAEALASELLISVLNDIKIDEEELLKYIKVAMKGELDEANYYYGLVNAYGIGVKKNEEEAFKYFKIAAEKGCEKSIIKIANWYKHGVYVKANPHTAIKWYKKAAEKFNADAIKSIIEIYEKGIGLDVDYKRAFEGAKLLREASVVEGNLKLAYYYIEGIGTEVNIEKAERIIAETMELDEGETLNFLGQLAECEIYKKGDTKAITYHLQAIENECINAKVNLEYYLYKEKNNIKSDYNFNIPFYCGKESYLKAIKIYNSGKKDNNITKIEQGIRALKRSLQKGFYPAIIEIIDYYNNEEKTRGNLVDLSKYKQKANYYNLFINEK